MRTLRVANILWIVVIFQLCAQCLAWDPSIYKYSRQLNDNYTIHWKVDIDTDQLYLGLEVQTTGWIGFGLGEPTSGGMRGSDIVIVYIEDGNAVVSDRYATERAEPLVDKCQNWILDEASESDDGFTRAQLRRALDTGDSQDRPIVIPSSSKIVWAFGETDRIAYHESRRGADVLEWIPPSKPITVVDPTWRSEVFRFPNVTIPAQRTTYMCSAFALPKESGHIVQFDPVISDSGEPFVHHLIAHLCRNNSYTQRIQQNAEECVSPIGDLFSGCESVAFGWARGMGSLRLPPEAGFPVGTDSKTFPMMVIEMHYDNPDLEEGETDSSGIRMHWTTEKRLHDAGTMILGDPLVSASPIPAGQSSFPMEFECSSSCTTKWEYPEVTAFASMLHMHALGSQMWTSHWRGSEYLGDVSRVDFFDYDFQQSTPIYHTIRQGDRLNTHCVFDSRSQTSETKFGIASNEEMCMHFVSYYPLMENRPFCGYADNAFLFGHKRNYTICGKLYGAVREFNPTQRDPPSWKNPQFSSPCSNSEAMAMSLWIFVSLICFLLM